MTFTSILFQENDSVIDMETQQLPAYFKDLNLDQIIDSITAGMQKYNLKPFFFQPLYSEDTIRYRQEVMQDLECEELLKKIKTFSEYIYDIAIEMQKISEYLTKPDEYGCNYLTKGKMLKDVDIYCRKINHLACDLLPFDLKSRGLLEFRKYISEYARSDTFTTLKSGTKTLKAELATVRYCMLIKDTTIKVQKYDDELTLTPKIEKTFQRFSRSAAKCYIQNVSDEPYAEHVEVNLLNLVAKLYPNIFLDLDNYCIKNMDFVNQILFIFSREIQFYIAYLEYINQFKKAELSFCYPQVSSQCKEVHSIESFDLALADKLIAQNQPVVCNDFYLRDKERIIVVSGPNQGGKTTFARTFGQLHYLGSLGCPVPGREAQLFLFDKIYTHFEREENIQNLSGKLQDDLIRMHDILEHATKDSILIINEILSSTTLKDAVAIGKKIMDSIIQLDSLCVWVTFLDELASYNKKIVSMISTVLPEDPVQRTYRIIRSPANGLAYAIDIVQKYRLTYDLLKERIKS